MTKMSMAALAICGVICAAPGYAQTVAQPIHVNDGAAVSVAAPEPAKPEGGGTKQGIQVHGHWKIDVINPDGTLASHHEFENALTSGGPTTGVGALSNALVGAQTTVGNWGIVLTNTGGDLILMQSGATYAGSLGDGIGTAVEVNSACTGGAAACASTLSVQIVSNQVSVGSVADGPISIISVPVGMSLSGAIVSPGGTISYVQTVTETCGPSVTPAACPSLASPETSKTLYQFTAASLATPIVTVSGQTVLVTVTISFS